MNIVTIIAVFLVTFIAAIDQFNLIESFYQPIVLGPVVGFIMGDLHTGLVVGGTYQLMTIGNMPVGGAQPPNAVLGGIMATVLAISLKLEDPAAAVGAAVPFALLGQYIITFLFTAMSPIMKVADKHAAAANPKGIVRLNYTAMAILGTLFGLVSVLFFIGGEALGKTISEAIPVEFMAGLGAAGKMMRFVGFAILLKVMISKDLWGFYFAGFAMAILFNANEALQGPALLLLALIGFAIAYWDFQIQTKLKVSTVAATTDGGEEDGI